MSSTQVSSKEKSSANAHESAVGNESLALKTAPEKPSLSHEGVSHGSASSRKGVFLSLLLLLLLMPIAFFSIKGSGAKGEKVRVTTSESRTVVSRVLAQGKIKAKRQVDVAPEISGRVIEIYVKLGQNVEKDAPLFSLDDEQYQNAVAQVQVAVRSANAAIDRAQLLVKEAERNLKRDQDLANRNIGSHEQVRVLEARLAMSLTDVRQAKAKRERVRLDLLRAKENLRKTRVLAPIGGTVVDVGLEVGQVISNVGAGALSGASLSGTSKNHVVIADLSELNAALDVDELDIAQVEKNQRARLRAQGAVETVFSGIVDEVGLLGQSAGGAVSFDVKVRVLPEQRQNNDDKKSARGDASVEDATEIQPELRFGLLRPGMSISAEIEVERLQNAIVVPVSAVLEARREHEDDRIFVVKNNHAVERKVKLGPSEGDLIAVLSGLSADELVVEGPFRALRTLEDGAAVAIDEMVELPAVSSTNESLMKGSKEQKTEKTNSDPDKIKSEQIEDDSHSKKIDSSSKAGQAP